MNIPKYFRRIAAVGLLLALASTPALAISKQQFYQLQQQVSLLMSQIQTMQQNFTTDLAVMKSLVQQNTDSISKLTLSLNSLQQSITAINTNGNQEGQSIAQQFQSVTDTLAEIDGRLRKMQDTLSQVQQAQQNIPSSAAAASNSAPAGGGGAPGPAIAPAPAPNSTVAPEQLYQNALSDYVSGAYPLARQEFEQYLKAYPQGGHNAQAAFYLGDIYSRERHYRDAIAKFNEVIERYPDYRLAPSAELKKAEALAEEGQTQASIDELRSLIRNYPISEEAREAKAKLRGLGVPLTAPKRHN